MKRGPVAFKKKAARRAAPKKPKCNLCGRIAQAKKMLGGLCPYCRGLR